MKLENSHLMLALAPDESRAAEAVRLFFARTQLVRYDTVTIAAEKSLTGGHSGFWERIEEGVAENRRVLAGILAELKKAGVRALDDLAQLPQGYQSKLAHTATHLLDGFFGIDSAFYNLVEDSHWLSEPLRREIARRPEEYHLLTVKAELDFARRQNLVSTLRSFET